MAVTTNYNVKIGGVLLSEQPSRVIPKPPKAARFQDILGGFLSFTKTFGWSFDLEWGSETLSDNDAATAVLARQTAMAGPTTTLAFTWYDGVEYTFTVIWTEAVSAAFRWGSNVEKFTISLKQAAVVETF